MTQNATTATLEQWLREAFAPEPAGERRCPPPEAFHELAGGFLEGEAADRLTRHAASCPACAAELDLAQAFITAPEGVDAAVLAELVERVEGSLPVQPERMTATPRVLPFRSRETRRPERSSAWRSWAVAALLVLAAGLGYRGLHGPSLSLPSPEGSEVLRGSEVEILSPAGELQDLPRELLWVPYRGAASYRVRLLAVDDAVLWEGSAKGARIALPAELVAGLHRAVSYRWVVEALDAAGRPLAASEPTRFVARPTP